ncbi:unnamed protein product, partial [Discosporangium mesarthrocarpum]
QTNVFIQLKALEIRTEAAAPLPVTGGQGGDTGAGETWNQEPLDHTKHQGEGRAEFGCPSSRSPDMNSQAYTSSSDHFTTLSEFAKWREALPAMDRLGHWHLLTACYDEGVQGMSYIGVACSDNKGVGWTSLRPFGTWEIMAHELGHALGGSDFLDGTKDVMRMVGRWNGYLFEREETRQQICQYISSAKDCLQDYVSTCGNGVEEPGEECDDHSPCCDPATCMLVPNARCSQGNGWMTSLGWVGQCCSETCQFLSSTTLCEV